MINTAIELAVRAHSGQIDKGGQPYIFHPLRVMLSSRLTTETARICAVLHDVLEDTTVQAEELRAIFGSEILSTLQVLTHPHGEPYKEYISRVRTNPVAVEVKLADLDDNTLPSRQSYLDESTRTRLDKKYSMAYRMLLGEKE